MSKFGCSQLELLDFHCNLLSPIFWHPHIGPINTRKGQAWAHRYCSGQYRSGPFTGQNWAVFNWNSLIFTGTFCHSFSDVPRFVQSFPKMCGPGHTGGVLGRIPALVPSMPQRGRPGHTGTVLGNLDMAPVMVKSWLFSIGTFCFSLEYSILHLLVNSQWSHQSLRGIG